MRTLKKLSPHGAILIANMYYVFWGIDRVNKSMNFIDNEYTKGLFLILLGFTAVNLTSFWQGFARWARRKSDAARAARLGLMAATALFAIVYFILWIVDCFAPDKMLMLRESVKLWMLILCILNTIGGILLAAEDRAALRRARTPRRTAPGAPRRPAGYDSPARSRTRYNSGYAPRRTTRYGDGYGASRSRYGDSAASRHASYDGDSRRSRERSRWD